MDRSAEASCCRVMLLGFMLTLSLATPSSGEKGKFSMSFEYRSLGIGPQPTVGVLLLRQGEEERLVSRVILEVMQELAHSIVKPELDLDELLPPKRRWETDVVPLPATEVEEYVELDPSLPRDRILGRKFKGRFAVVEKELRFELAVELYHKGARGKFRKMKKKHYNSSYFFERAKTSIRDRLVALTDEGEG